MPQSTHLALPYIDAAQAQKHVTHNEALQLLDALTHLSVSARGATAPPAAPAEGERLLVGSGAAGAFAGMDGRIAAFLAGAWTFLTPRAGWRLYVEAERSLLIFDGAGWVDAGGVLGALQDLSRLGVGAAADANNPLTAKLNSALFTAKEAASGGTGDLRVTLNKESAAGFVSQLYQTNFSGRAETGLTGDDNFHVKVSPDGATWKDALVINRNNGFVGLGGTPTSNLTVNRNASASLPAAPAETALHVAGVTGQQVRVTFDAFANSVSFIHRRANGTPSSPSALLANNFIGSTAAFGYGATGYTATGRAQFLYSAAENWTDTAQGTFISFYTTPNGTTAQAERLRIAHDGSVGIGTAAPTAKLHVDGPVRIKVYTVATLPAAASSGGGARAFVSDAAAPVFMAAVVGGGGVFTPVYSDGANWRVG